MDRRRKVLVAVWIAFGLFWVFLAAMTAINPVLEPAHGPPIILILQSAMVLLCGLVVVRILWSRRSPGTKEQEGSQRGVPRAPDSS